MPCGSAGRSGGFWAPPSHSIGQTPRNLPNREIQSTQPVAWAFISFFSAVVSTPPASLHWLVTSITHHRWEMLERPSVCLARAVLAALFLSFFFSCVLLLHYTPPCCHCIIVPPQFFLSAEVKNLLGIRATFQVGKHGIFLLQTYGRAFLGRITTNNR